MGYVSGLIRNKALEMSSGELKEETKEDYEKTGKKQRLFTEIYYQAGTWSRRRRVIVKAERSQHSIVSPASHKTDRKEPNQNSNGMVYFDVCPADGGAINHLSRQHFQRTSQLRNYTPPPQ